MFNLSVKQCRVLDDIVFGAEIKLSEKNDKTIYKVVLDDILLYEIHEPTFSKLKNLSLIKEFSDTRWK